MFGEATIILMQRFGYDLVKIIQSNWNNLNKQMVVFISPFVNDSSFSSGTMGAPRESRLKIFAGVILPACLRVKICLGRKHEKNVFFSTKNRDEPLYVLPGVCMHNSHWIEGLGLLGKTKQHTMIEPKTIGRFVGCLSYTPENIDSTQKWLPPPWN